MPVELTDEDIGLSQELTDADIGLEEPTKKEPGAFERLASAPTLTRIPTAGEVELPSAESVSTWGGLLPGGELTTDAGIKITQPPGIALPLVRPPTGPGVLPKIAGVGAGVYNTLASIPNFVMSPEGAAITAATAVAGPEAAPIVKGLFAGLMAKGAGEQLGEASVTKDPQTAVEGIGAAALGSTIPFGRGTFGVQKPITVEPRAKTISEIEDRFQAGKVVPPTEAPVVPAIERPVVPRETPKPERGLPEDAATSDLMADMTEAGRKAFRKATSKPDELIAVDVTDLSPADRRNLARLGLSFSEDRNRRILATYTQRMRAEDLRRKVTGKPSVPPPTTKSAQVSSKLVEEGKPATPPVEPAIEHKALETEYESKTRTTKSTTVTKDVVEKLEKSSDYARELRDSQVRGSSAWNRADAKYKTAYKKWLAAAHQLEDANPPKPVETPKVTVATEKTGAEPPPAPTKAEAGEQVKRIARGVSGISRFTRETELTGPDILSWIQDNMKLLSKSNARQSWGRDKFNLNKSLWDDAPQRLSAPHHNIIYGSKGFAPDRVAQAAFDAGILKEPTVNELWRAIKSSSEKRVGEVAKQKREAKWIEEDQKQYSEWAEATKKGGQAVSGELLQVGDVLDVDGQKVEVTGKAEDGTVTLKDGRRFGTQKLGENETIYVETFEGLEGGEDFLPPEEQPKPKKAPAELFTAQETPFNLAGEKATFVEPTKEATGFGQETLTQNDLFNIQQVTKDVDPFKSAKAAQQLYGKDAVAKIQNQLRVMDSDPEVRKSFTKEQRARLNEVLNVLRQQSPPAAGERGISIGPGAQSRVGDAPLESQLNQLSRNIRLQSISPKEPFTKRLSDALDLAGRWAKGKDAVTQTLARMTAAKDSLWNSYKNLPPWNDFTSTIGRWIGADTETAMQVREFQKSIKQIVPSKLRREAITNWIQADGKDDVLRARMEASKPSVRKGYEVALNLNDAEKILARNIQSYFESRLKEGIDAGLLKQGVDDYVTQIWKRPVKTTQKLMADLFGDGTLNPTFRFARERIFNSYFEGEQAGYIPRNKDIGHLISVYDMAFNRALSARAMIRELQNGTAKDGNPIVMTSGQGVPLPAGESPPEAVLIKPNYSPKGAVSADGRQYKPIDHWALRDWKWASKVGDTPVFLQGDMLVHPDHFTHLQNVLKKSRLRQYPVTGALLRAAAFAKQTKLSLSPFHTVQEGVHALAHRVNPINPAEIDLAIPEQKSLVDHGLMIADPRGYELFTEGMSGGGLVGKIPGLGNLQQWYTEVTFRDYIPRLKMSMAVDALERNRKAYANQIKSGKVTDDQIVALTARESNAAFGEQNYRMMGRSATTQDFLRLALLAPDFLEARFRFVGQALKPYGREQRIALALMGATLYTGSRVLNKALDDDYHWNKPFSVFSGGKEYRLRTILGDVQHLVNDPRSFWYNRLSPATRTAIEYVTSRDDRGIKRNSAEQFADFLQWFKPIPVQIRPGGTAAQSVLASVGIPATIYGKQQELYEIMDSWRKRQSDPKIKEAYDRQRQETHVTSPYGPLRMALNSANLRQAKEEYLKLRLTRTPDQIEKTMAMNRPFTGSTVFEEKFKASLTPEEKKIYAEAKKERKRMYQRFQQMLRIPNR